MKNLEKENIGKKLLVSKKDKTVDDFDPNKIIRAATLSADRVLVTLSESDKQYIKSKATEKAYEVSEREGTNILSVEDMHRIVEHVIEMINPAIAKSYRDYRNYKIDFVHMLDDVYKKSQSIMYLGDKENSNTNSALVSTKRSLIFNELNRNLYKKFFLNTLDLKAIKDGYIYIHDMSARRDTINCCNCDIERILKDGFEMGNIWYNEPRSLDTAFDVIGDVVLSAASQQYGGFTVPQVDQVLAPYAELSYKRLFNKYKKLGLSNNKAKKQAFKDVKREMEQGFQGWEYKFNTLASSRGDYPFIAMTFGIGTSNFERLASLTALKVREKGQGKKGKKRPVLFPKYIFLYDENLHGKGGTLRRVYDQAVQCSSETMYPDWLSLTGEGYVSSIYKRYGKVISPMGCRAFLSPWYIRGGIEPADGQDEPVFIGRFNVGAVSLHLPMILAKARQENRDFYEVLDYYLEIVRNLHKRTYEYLGEMRASTNPLMYCEGGLYGGHLKPDEKIKPLLKSATASFGITALNELQMLYNKKSITEDGQFAIEVMEHINKRIVEYKKEDGHLYAIYGTPAESLCGLQVTQFREKYGIVTGVSDREYVSNSFHCHVTEDIKPTEKQDKEARFWDLFNGGKIQYVKYPIRYNKLAIETLLDRAMKMGLYEGVNLSMSYCGHCGHKELDLKGTCPKCNSDDIVTIERMNGYLSYSRVKGDTTLNEAKMVEIGERVSM